MQFNIISRTDSEQILENFTDALVRDSRIFHVENVNAFSDSFNAYSMFHSRYPSCLLLILG